MQKEYKRGEHIGELVKKKVVLLGDSAVGKTSLIRRYVIDEFHDHYIETIGTKVSRKDLEIEIDGKEFSLSMQIWDVLGQKAYSAVQSKALVGMNGALLVADITRKETLDNIESYWIPTLKKVVTDAHLIFLANKEDLKDTKQFNLDELIQISSKYTTSDEHGYFLTSAKTGENVEEAFFAIARMMLSSQVLEDPTKEIFEELMAESVLMERDKTSIIGVTDTIITDFCSDYEDKEKGMKVLQDQFVKAGVEISKPTKQGMIRAIEYLAEEELKFMDEAAVNQRKEKWLRMVRGVKED
ncbi:MAG: GTP-binding protein [Thermoplasmata archaeon]|nr:MAG: GTP-binding protein [Thermoplasmata archaeon]